MGIVCSTDVVTWSTNETLANALDQAMMSKDVAEFRCEWINLDNDTQTQTCHRQLL